MGIVAGDESSLDAAETSMALRVRASVLVDEMTVVSKCIVGHSGIRSLND